MSLSIYAVQEIAIAPGEQMRWTRNDTERGVRNGQVVTIAVIDAKGTATLKDSSGNEATVELTGQQYLDYGLVSTTYSSQGKTADQVLVAVDSTISKEGLYVAVSRAKQKLSLYTASKEKLFKQAERSAAKENPSDYLTLFNLVNPDAENQKTAGTARELRGADQSEYISDSLGRLRHRAGECVALGHRAAVRRDSTATAGSEPVEDRAASLSPEYVADVRGVVSGIAECHRIEALRQQAERIGKAAQGFIDGAGQLEHTAAAVARLDGQLEQQAKGVSAIRLEPNRDLDSLRDAEQLSDVAESTVGQRPSTQADGVAEVMLRSLDLRDLARYKAQIAKAKTAEKQTETKQESVQRQEQPKQRVKKRDQGMEL